MAFDGENLQSNPALLREALQALISFMTGPAVHDAVTSASGVDIDRALFNLFVLIYRSEPVRVDALAQLMHRDQSTISRQLEKLEQFGIVERRLSKADARVREVVVTKKGKAVARRIYTASEKTFAPVFAGWSEKEVEDFLFLILKFVEDGQNVFKRR